MPGPLRFAHRGYTGTAEYEPDDAVFFGTADTGRDTVTFEGETIEEAEAAFRESMDVYLSWCEERGEEPAPPRP